MKPKEILLTIWLLVMSYFTLATYIEQRQGIKSLDGSITNQDTLKSNQKIMLKNQDTLKMDSIRKQAENLIKIVNKNS